MTGMATELSGLAAEFPGYGRHCVSALASGRNVA